MELKDIQAHIREWEQGFDTTGISGFEIKICKDYVMVSGFLNGRMVAKAGDTIGETLQKFRLEIPAASERAKQLRDEARKLLREAVELEVKIGGPQ